MFSALKALKVVAGGDRKRDERETETVTGEPFEMPIEISWLTEEANGTRSMVSFRTIVRLTSAEALSHLKLKVGAPRNRVTLVKMFSDSVAAGFRQTIERQGYSKVIRVRGKIDRASFDEVMAALERRGLVIEAEAPAYVKQRSKYWQLSRTGAEWLERE